MLKSAVRVEASSKPCDTGSSIDDLKREFPDLDYSQLDCVFPDKTSPRGQKYAYNKAAILARGRSCLENLYRRHEKVVLVVSHSAFLRTGVTTKWFFNGDFRIFDFSTPTSDQNSQGDLNLAEWELTSQQGGLGKSRIVTESLGTGIPE